MVVEYIRYAVKDGARRNELVLAYDEAARSLDASPECLAYELSLCEEDATAAVLRIEWVSTEAHLQGFRKSVVFRGFFAAIRPFVNEIAEMRHYVVTGVGNANRSLT